MARGITGGKFALELDGINAGWVFSAEGGSATSDVITEKVGADIIVHKHLAGVKYEDITVSCGAGMSRGFHDWIKASIDHKHKRKDGSIVYADYDGKEYERRDFFHALITEIGFPGLDAASKDAAKLTVKFAPEITRKKYGAGGSIAPNKFPLGRGEQKKWSTANFKLQIDGLDCTRVNKIEPLVIKQKVVEHAIGEMRDYQKEAANLEFSNLVVTMATSHAHKFNKWHEDFVVKGNNEQQHEKTGTLEFLTANLKTALFTVTFHGLGIFKLTDDKVESGSENIRRTKAEMYCEYMTFKYHSDSVFA